jgi:hypothetical protein
MALSEFLITHLSSVIDTETETEAEIETNMVGGTENLLHYSVEHLSITGKSPILHHTG